MTIAPHAALATPRGHAARRQALGARLLAGVMAPGALLLIGIHLLALRRGPAWISPLLIGDHLFDLAFALTILWYCLALGRKVGRPLLRLDADGFSDGLAALGLGLVTLSLALLALGFLHLYYGAVLLAATLALTWWLWPELAGSSRRVVDGLACWARDGFPTAPSFGQRLVLLVLVLTLLLVLIRATLPATPTTSGIEWDALAYHLAAPKIYLAAHAFVPRPDLTLANAPSGGDLLYILGLAAGTDVMAKMLTVLLALLLGVATFALGRRHFGPDAGWLGALLVYTNLWIVPIMPATVPDFGAAFMVVLGASDLLTWAERCREDAPRGARSRLTISAADRLLVRAGLLIGGAVSFKLTNVPAAAALPPAVALVSFALSRGTPTRRLLPAIRHAVLAGAATIVAPAPWLLKNLVAFGTPLYPATVAINDSGAHPMAALAGVGAHPSPAAHLWWLLSTLATTYWHYITPLSPLLLLAPFLTRRPAARAALLLLIIGGLLWLLFIPLYLPPRYWLGFVGVADALTAAVVCEIMGRRLRRPLALLLFAALGLDGAIWLIVVPFSVATPFWVSAVIMGELLTILVVVVVPRRRERAVLLALPVVAYLTVAALVGFFAERQEIDKSQALAVATGSLPRQAFLLRNGATYPVDNWLNTHTPPHTPVVMIHDILSYYVDRPYLADFYGARNARLRVPATRHAEFVAWCEAGIRTAIFNRGPEEASDPPGIRPLSTFAWTRTPGLRPRVLFSNGGVDVLAITPCDATHAL